MTAKDSTAGPTIAVVGSRGFLGRALVRAARAGRARIAELGRNDPLAAPDGSPAPAVASADVVYYFASTVNPATAEQYPDRAERDLAVFRAFVRSVHRTPRPPAIVLPGSGGTVYDTRLQPPYHEDAPLAPVSRYGRIKRAMEQVLLEERPDGCRAVVVRISNVYGPGQPVGTGQGVIANWLHAVLEGREVVLYGAESTTRDFVYIDDVAAALLRVADSKRCPLVINVGSGSPTSLAELMKAIDDVVSPEKLRIRKEPARGFDVRHNFLDVDLARVELGWKPQVSLREGIARTWDALRRTLGE